MYKSVESQPYNTQEDEAMMVTWKKPDAPQAAVLDMINK